MPHPSTVLITQAQNQSDSPKVEIIEQPASKGTRFRYKTEGEKGGQIFGANHSRENPSNPTIRVVGSTASACVVVVSCVESEGDKPRAHPHELVGTDCSKGVCTKKIKSGLDRIKFNGLGITCHKKNESIDELERRKQIRVDPYRRGFDHNTKEGLKEMNLSEVRLCFQVFLPDHTGKYQRPLAPVLSGVIYDKKNAYELAIMEMSITSAPFQGKSKLMMFTGKILKDDIRVRFFEMDGSAIVWENLVDVPVVHQGYGLSLSVPPYNGPSARNQSVKVKVQLISKKRKDEECEPKEFTYTPDNRKRGFDDMGRSGSKRLKQEYDHSTGLPATVRDLSVDSNGSYPNTTSMPSNSGTQVYLQQPQPIQQVQHLQGQPQPGQPQQFSGQGAEMLRYAMIEDQDGQIIGSDKWFSISSDVLKPIKMDPQGYALQYQAPASQELAQTIQITDDEFNRIMANSTEEGTINIPSTLSERFGSTLSELLRGEMLRASTGDNLSAELPSSLRHMEIQPLDSSI